MSKICTNCSTENPDDAIRCSSCGQTEFYDNQVNSPPQEKDLILTERVSKSSLRISAESIAQSVDKTLILGREGDIEPEFFKDFMHISRRHCKIYFKDGEYLVEHISNTNQTIINNESLVYGVKRILRNDNTLILADMAFHISISEKPIEPEVVANIEMELVVICPKCRTKYIVPNVDVRIPECKNCDKHNKNKIAKIAPINRQKNAN